MTLPAVTTWTPMSASIQVTEGIVSLTVFHILSSVGSLSIDEASLVAGSRYSGTPFDHGMVTLSFDDAWTSQLTDAVPVMNANNIKGTFAVITSEMQNADLQLPEDQVYLNTAEMRTIQDGGHEIASHSRTHPDLTILSPSDLS